MGGGERETKDREREEKRREEKRRGLTLHQTLATSTQLKSICRDLLVLKAKQCLGLLGEILLDM